MTTPEVERRVEKYFSDRNYAQDTCLGVGTQGSVFTANVPSQQDGRYDQIAVKFHDRKIAYNHELGVYLRLKDLDIDSVCGHRIPILIDYDDDLLAIEMTIVSPPFCLDFGGAYLDRVPDYSPEVWADWEEQKSEVFESDWPVVQEILATFASFGVYIADINPGNIKFR